MTIASAHPSRWKSRVAMLVGAALLAAATLVAGPTGPAAALPTDGDVSGTISAPGATDPSWWKGVTVSLDSTDDHNTHLTTTIGSSGYYEFLNVDSGYYAVNVTVTGYLTAGPTYHPVNLVTPAPKYVWFDTVGQFWYSTDFTLVPGVEIAGHVDTPAGTYPNWTSGAVVSLYYYGCCDAGYMTSILMDTAQPDSSGNYSFIQLPANSYFVKIEPNFTGLDTTSSPWMDASAGQVFTPSTTLLASSGYALASSTLPAVTLNRAGSALTTSAGTWTPATPDAYTYQWRKDGKPIGGATASTYAFSPEDRGHTFTATVTATKTSYLTAAATSLDYLLPLLTFSPTPVPTISGGTMSGATLTANPGTWDAHASLAYRWLRDGSKIDTGTASTYVLTDDDLGHTISVDVTGSATGYATVTKSSDGFSVPVGAFATPPTPSIAGIPQVGSTLTATTDSWSPAATFAYQWLSAGVPIPGATGSSYVPTASDVGSGITVAVTGSRTGYASQTVASAAVSVAAGTFTKTPTPAVSGIRGLADTLTAKPYTWSPSATLSYRWYRNGYAISGATHSTYKLTSSDSQKKITVKVTGTRPGFTTVTTTSATLTMPKFFTKAPTPTITGTGKAGYTLTAHRGTWSPTPTYSYRWYRNGVAISGATKSTYKLTSSDKGKKITVTVTAKRSGYGTDSKTSAAKTVAN